MARSSAAKKVAKAASTGAGGRDAQTERNILFPAAMALVVLLGIALIFVARDRRSENAPRGEPTTQDHWHSTYGIYVCDTIETTVYRDDAEDVTGIHTHDDGLIHIHPFVSTVSGQFATLGSFFDEIDIDFSDSSLTLPNGSTLAEGETMCGEGEEEAPAEFRVLKWNTLDAEAPLVSTEDLRNVRFNENGQVFMLAWVHPDTADDEIPRPDDTFLRQYLGLPAEQQPILNEDNPVGPTAPSADDTGDAEGSGDSESTDSDEGADQGEGADSEDSGTEQ